MAGIGIFLTHIGLQAGNGIDILRDNAAVLVDVTILEAPYAARCWVGITIFLITSVLIILRVPGAIVSRAREFDPQTSRFTLVFLTLLRMRAHHLSR